MKSVYDLVRQRIDLLFREFDNIYVSFSGGKDSGVMLNLCIQHIRENNLKRKIGVFHMDYEVQYGETLRYIDRVLGPTSSKSTAYASPTRWLRVLRCTRLSGGRGTTAAANCGYVRCRKTATRKTISRSTRPRCGTTISTPSSRSGIICARGRGRPAVWWASARRRARTAGARYTATNAATCTAA